MKTKIGAALDDRVSRFLKLDTVVTPAPSSGYLGDATVTHAIRGSPLYRSHLKVAGPIVVRTGINSIQASQFALGRKLYR